MLKKLLLFCTLTLSSVAAQTRVLADNAHGWYNYFGDHPIGGSKWGVHLEGQWRRHDVVARWQQLLLRPAVNYSIHPNITLTAGYGYIATMRYGEFPVAVPFPEHRVFEQAQVSFKIGKVNNIHRYRLEQRELGELAVAPDGRRRLINWRHENRFRYMYRLLIPLKGKWSVALYDEVFVNFGKNVTGNIFDQNRAYAAIGYNVTKTNRLEVGFMEQTLQQRNGRIIENNHTLMVAWYSTTLFGRR
jgi:hypothetical protein